MNRKDSPTPRVSRASTSKPFVVAGLATKRYVPAKKDPVPKQRVVRQPTPTKERPAAPRARVAAKKLSHPGRFPKVAQKVESPRPSPQTNPAPSNATGVQKSIPTRLSVPVKRSLCETTTVPKRQTPSKPVERMERRVIDGYPAAASVPHRPTQVARSNEVPSRPGCVPCGHIHQPSVVVSGTSEEKRPATPSKHGLPSKKSSVVAGVADNNSTGTRPRNRSPLHQKVAYPSAIGSMPFASPSPAVSSSPSASVEQVKAALKIEPFPTSNLGALAGSSVTHAPTSVVEDTFDDLSGCTDYDSSLVLQSSPTVINSLPNPKSMVALNSIVNISSIEGSLVEVSCATSTATIIQPSKKNINSLTLLARVMVDSQVSPPFSDTDSRSKTSTIVKGAFEIARSFFSQPTSQSDPEATSAETMSTNVSRMRKVFIPPLEKDAKASPDALTQMEVEMLRAQKKVAGGGLVDLRLERLGSLSAMAIVMKRRASLGQYKPSVKRRGV